MRQHSTARRCDEAAAVSGPAALHLRRGVYVASRAELDRDVVTYTGRRRERNPDRLYTEHTRSVRLCPGEWIDWGVAEVAT